MHQFIFAFIGLSAILYVNASAKVGVQAACPDRIAASAIKNVQAPDGWLGSTPGPIYLDATGMMVGPPDSMLYLVPSKSTPSTQTFEFVAGDRQRWLWCGYGGAQLARRLDDAATRCVIKSRAAKAGAPMIAAVECR